MENIVKVKYIRKIFYSFHIYYLLGSTIIFFTQKKKHFPIIVKRGDDDL